MAAEDGKDATASAAAAAAPDGAGTGVTGEAVLTYFQGRGRGEMCRWALSAAGVPWRNGGTGPQPGGGMSTHEEFVALGGGVKGIGTEAGKLAFGQVPLLEVNGMRIVQTGTIVRWAARHGGLDGATDAEQVRVDEMCEAVRDWGALGIGYAWAVRRGEDPEPQLAFLHGKCLPRFEAFAKEYSGADGCFVGSKMTMADVMFAESAQQYIDSVGGRAWLDAYPACTAVHAAVVASPRIAAYLASGKHWGAQDALYIANVDLVMGR